MNKKYFYSIVVTLLITATFISCNKDIDEIRDLSGTITIIPNTDVTIGTELTATYNGGEMVTYQWNRAKIAIGGATDNKYIPTEAGSYTVTINAKGYNSKTSIAVDVAVKPFTVTFVTDGGNPIPENQLVTGGEKVTKPTEPTKANDISGLYLKTPPEFCTFDGWYNGETKWDFDTNIVTANITLKAKWSSTTINVTEQSGNNDVEKAIAYIKANPATYTLLIDKDVDIKPQLLEGNNLRLTLIGLGGERRIKLSTNDNLFLLNAWGGMVVELILGNNITLVGRSVGGNGNQNNNSPVVMVQGATFTMLDGSKITGNTINSDYFGNAGAVYVHSGTVTMKGGVITDNKSIGPIKNYNVGGVYIAEGAFFKMEGGSIFGNIGEFSDVANSGTFTLNGIATIGTLTQTYVWYVRPTIFIESNWTGNVSSLNLYRSYNYMDNVIYDWENQVVVQATTSYSLTAADIMKFTLGNFVSSAESNNTQPINDTHKLVLDNGTVVLKKK